MLDTNIDNRLAIARDWSAADGQRLTRLLIAWFDAAARTLPWRENKDPYRIWLSEIMLQQTQVTTVIPYFRRFLETWPTLADLAAAREEQVLKQWEGLGYYSRARNLLTAARMIQNEFQGQWPTTEKEIRQLPGIGEYTAGAILSIAFGRKIASVDGNLVRVFSRLSGIPWLPSDPAQRREVRQLAESIMPENRPGDWNEALMDLGATICLPRQPNCADCPLREICVAQKQGLTEHLPLKPAKKSIPVEKLTVLVFVRDGSVHVCRRPEKGLLAGLYEFDWLPGIEAGTASHDLVISPIEKLRLDFPAAQLIDLGHLTHQFTHRQWQMNGYLVKLGDAGIQLDSGIWVSPDELAALPFPTALAGYRSQVLSLL